MYKLREIEKKDLPSINQWRNDKGVIDCLGAPFRYINVNVDEAWFEGYMRSRNNCVRCAIVSEECDDIIGLVSLVSIDHLNQSAEFHIMIGNSANQGKGAGTFAVREILKHAFFNLNLQRVELTALEDNQRARHLYEKVGFVQEGVKRAAKYKNGRFVNMIAYAILKSEFIAKQENL